MEAENIVIISPVEGIFIRALSRQIREEGMEPVYVGLNHNYLYEIRNKVRIYILYLSDNSHILTACISFLKEEIQSPDKEVLVIGSNPEIVNIDNSFPDFKGYSRFEKTVSSKDLLSFINRTIKSLDEGREKRDDKKSILIVDDDPAYARTVREWLKNDYLVNMVTGGMQAIRFLLKTKVDLILLDYEMPAANGANVMEMLKEDPDTKDIPVVFLTGVGDKESVMKVIGLKPEGYILKSATKYEIVNWIKEFFDRRNKRHLNT